MGTTGNVLGSMVNWLLGRYIEHWRHKRWFPWSFTLIVLVAKAVRYLILVGITLGVWF